MSASFINACSHAFSLSAAQGITCNVLIVNPQEKSMSPQSMALYKNTDFQQYVLAQIKASIGSLLYAHGITDNDIMTLLDEREEVVSCFLDICVSVDRMLKQYKESDGQNLVSRQLERSISQFKEHFVYGRTLF